MNRVWVGLVPVLGQSAVRPEVLWIGVLIMLGIYGAVMYSGSRREKQKRREMLAGIKKNDRVMTIGGMIGTVVQVKDEEVVLKIDESTNAKASFVRGAIQKVLREDEPPTLDGR